MPAQYEPGTYWMERPVVGTAESKEKKTPYIYIEGNVTHKANGEQSTPVVTVERRTVFMYLSDGAWPYTVEKIEGLGFNGDFNMPKLAAVEQDGGLWVTCKHETYQGKTKERWDLPGKGMEHTAPEADTIRKINAMYKMAKGKPSSKPAPPKPPEKPTGTDADGVPF
jgi:hypothetical protein